MALNYRGIGRECLMLLPSCPDWDISRYTDNNGTHVYAEHLVCKGRDGGVILHDPNIAMWSWEHDDPSPRCWHCTVPCPEEVMGLVLLYNFDNLHREGG